MFPAGQGWPWLLSAAAGTGRCRSQPSACVLGAWREGSLGWTASRRPRAAAGHPPQAGSTPPPPGCHPSPTPGATVLRRVGPGIPGSFLLEEWCSLPPQLGRLRAFLSLRAHGSGKPQRLRLCSDPCQEQTALTHMPSGPALPLGALGMLPRAHTVPGPLASWGRGHSRGAQAGRLRCAQEPEGLGWPPPSPARVLSSLERFPEAPFICLAHLPSGTPDGPSPVECTRTCDAQKRGPL